MLNIADVSKLDAEVSAMRMDIDGIVMDYAVKDNLKKKVSHHHTTTTLRLAFPSLSCECLQLI